MKKLSPGKKKLLIHGAILAVGVAATWYYPPNFIWWNLGYALYFIARLVDRLLRRVPRGVLKVLLALLLSVACVPLWFFLMIPGWLFSVSWSISHPDYARDLAEYRIFQDAPPLRNAAYCRDYNSWMYEGDISEEDLKRLAIRRNWEFKPIEKPVGADSTLDRIAEFEARKRGEKIVPAPEHRVEQGLFCSTYPPGNDCGEVAVWDRVSGRLYVRGTSR